MANNALQVTQLEANIGAQIDGIDLRKPISPSQVTEIHEALMRHHVVFFRDQELSDEQHLAFASCFGKIAVGGPFELREIAYAEDSQESPPCIDEWHTDSSCLPEPPAIAFLCSIVSPKAGGDTVWVNLEAAYEALSAPMQKIVDGLQVRHFASPNFLKAAVYPDGGLMPLDKIQGLSVEHPLVRTHPVTGRRSLFLSHRFVDAIVGLHPDESELLLNHLNRHLDNLNFQMRWRWRAHDLAMWDEPSTNHRALSDHYPQYRKMRRCTVEGGRPFFDATERQPEVSLVGASS